MIASDDQAPEETLQTALYDRVGGRETFARIMRAFFVGVRDDDLLAPMYAHDYDGSEQRLLLFFEQYWGGPTTYSRTRGAPMLRMRHMPYKVTPQAKDRWLALMHTAISTVEVEYEDEFLLRDYIERAAEYLINADD